MPLVTSHAPRRYGVDCRCAQFIIFALRACSVGPRSAAFLMSEKLQDSIGCVDIGLVRHAVKKRAGRRASTDGRVAPVRAGADNCCRRGVTNDRIALLVRTHSCVHALHQLSSAGPVPVTRDLFCQLAVEEDLVAPLREFQVSV